MQDRFISAGSDWSVDTGNPDSWGRQSGRGSTDAEHPAAHDGASTDLCAVAEALDESGTDHPEELHSECKEHAAEHRPSAAGGRALSPGTSLESIQESEEAEDAEEARAWQAAEDAIIEEEIARGGLSSAEEDADEAVEEDIDDAASDASSEALALAVAAHGGDLDDCLDGRDGRKGERRGANAPEAAERGGFEKQGSLVPSLSKGLTRLASLLPRREARGSAGPAALPAEPARGAQPGTGSLRAAFMPAPSLGHSSNGCEIAEDTSHLSMLQFLPCYSRINASLCMPLIRED